MEQPRKQQQQLNELYDRNNDTLVQHAVDVLNELNTRYLGASHRKELTHALWPLLRRLESQSA